MLIGMALVFSLFRGLTPWISQYKVQLESELSEILGEKVNIETMETGWYWFEPVIRLNHVELSHGAKQDLRIKQLIIGINLWSSLRQWQLQPGILLADGLNLDFNQANGKWQIKGLNRVGGSNNGLSINSLPALLRWILNQQRIDFKDSQMTLHLQGGAVIPIASACLSIENDQGVYKIKATAKMKQTVPSELQILGTLQLNAEDLKQSKGSIYIDINHALLTQWQSLLPKNFQYFESGNGRFQAWINLKSGKLQNVQGKVSLSNTAFEIPMSDRLYFIQKFSGQFAWHPSNGGWIFKSNDVMLKIHGENFKNQSLTLVYDNSQKSYQLASPSLDLKLLHFVPVIWPKSIQPFINEQMIGTMNHLNAAIDRQGLTHLFTQFNLDRLNNTKSHWQAEWIAGVIDWHRDGGKLKLNSTKSKFLFQNYPPLLELAISAELNWHREGKKWAIDKIYSSIKHKNLQMSNAGQAVIGDNLADSTLDITSQFIINNGEFWQPFIPDNVMQKGLKDWLTKDIKHIGKIVGELTLKGKLADFPFEHSKGQFLVQTSFSDLALVPMSGWPTATDLSGSVTVKGRRLEAAIFQGKFGENFVDQIKLSVDNLGLDKEVLRLHTQVESEGKSIVEYIVSTPLAAHLSALKKIHVQGSLAVDLQLEVPLFNHELPVYLLGDVTLKNNELIVMHDGIKFPLHRGYGHILFNEHGLTTGDLNGLLWNQPMNIQLKSEQLNPDPFLAVSLDGTASVDAISKLIPSPFWQFISGKAHINADLKITNKDTDLDSFYIRSDLKGIEINLPAPLHKSAEVELPSEIRISFNPAIGFRKEVKIGNIVSANMWYSVRENHVELNRGEIRLGGAKAVLPGNQGVQIVGTLPALTIGPWQRVLMQFPEQNQGSDFRDKLRFIDIRLGHLLILNQQFDKLACQISQTQPGKWQLKVKQKNLDMNVTYYSYRNFLTGIINRLNWTTTPNSDDLTSDLSPLDLPSINLKINSLNINKISLGQAAIEGHSLPDRWQLELLTLTSPYYQLYMSGDWQLVGSKNKTNIAGRMQFNNLGKALSQWHIKPVVSAKWGQIDFNSNLSKSPFDLDLSSISANLKVQFSNGVVTELSKVTEEKIGLGKLLSILSLQTIPRRLQLDFSDLSNKGYSFDKFLGKFTLNKGKLTTGSSEIDGPVACANIKGSLDLIKQTYSVKLRIVPHITASLPVVATIAGGPIAGAVTWVVSKIINQEMQRVTGYTYKIDGPWHNPQVRQLNIDKQTKRAEKKAN